MDKRKREGETSIPQQELCFDVLASVANRRWQGEAVVVAELKSNLH